MNLYDNYSDLFFLAKLVAASRTACPWAIETDDNLNFVSTKIRFHNLL